VGVAVGALLGPALLVLRRRSLHWYLMILGFAIAGVVAAELAAYFGDVVYPADMQLGMLGACAGVLAGVLLLRRGGRPLGLAGVLFAAGSLGAIAAGAIAFALPQQYVSRATLRMSTPVPPGNPAAPRIRELTERILSRSSIAEIIQRPSLDLYRAQRARLPMETVVGILRRDLHIEPVFEGGSDATLAISFRYSTPQTAQTVLREFVSRYMEENAYLSRLAGEGLSVPGSLNFVVIDPPSMPATPAAPNRLLLMVGGAGAGLGIAMLTWWVLRLTVPRRRNLLRIALSAGAAAAVIAAVIAIASPSRYLSTASVRLVAPAAPADTGAADDLQTRLGDALGSQTLIELIRQPGLDLYAKERGKLPIKDVLQLMRERDLRIETLQVSAAGRTESLRIAFEYPDREKAHGFVQALVSRLVEHPAAPDRLSRAYVEVVDPPSVPDAPQLPDRPAIITVGLIGGLLLGSAAILLRPRPAQAVLAG
jgi:uncharacterized protein involved in exopolysaccharide biosynthesis